jgi:HEAT repeat protein
MNQTMPTREALDQAFAALAAYKDGSSRAALLPLDQVAVCGPGADLETRLLKALEQPASEPARAYIFSKLAMVGTTKSFASLANASVLDTPSATAARTALENMPGLAATRALVGVLPGATPVGKVAVLNSLGSRRDAAAARPIAKLITSGETSVEVLTAAAAALGEIGSPQSAKALTQFHRTAPPSVRAALATAMLVCADRLLGQGIRKQARELYGLLTDASQPAQVREAAMRGLRACG